MTVRELLLRRRGLVFIPATAANSPPAEERLLQAVDLELAALGYVVSTRLRQQLGRLPPFELALSQRFITATLAAALGADKKHVPLFRRFPHDVPADTQALWIKKVLLHFYQAVAAPCLFCRRVGTTHVLKTCRHVICDRCFDGSNYSACPVCECQVDRRSPFFLPTAAEKRAAAPESVRFKLLDLGEDVELEARRLLVALAERKQALSPDDQDALGTLLQDYGEAVVTWLPEKIPLKENIAAIFGTLLKGSGSLAILDSARPHLATATDVLRLIAARSGGDPALQPKKIMKELTAGPRWHGKKARLFAPHKPGHKLKVSLLVRRFHVGKLSRPLRRGLLAILDGLPFEPMMEDLLRHRVAWVGVGESLHPFEYARRFPKAALAFAVLRKTTIGEDALGLQLITERESTPLVPRGSGLIFRTYYSRLTELANRGDGAGFTKLLTERPGELARRLDHALRLCLSRGVSTAETGAAFVARLPRLATPLLVMLAAHLQTRSRPASARIYWPKGQIAKGVSEPDKRSPLPTAVIEPLVRAIQGELMRRFAEKPPLPAYVIDTDLKSVVVPFNERTASRSAVALPRGSRLALPDGKLLRLFLHWCQPEHGHTTDIDLSVGLYDAAWSLCGVCSYYRLRFDGKKVSGIAQSSGDLRSALPPDGATEYVDLDRDKARAEGIRYVVMVVNNYAGMPFSKLDRGFAGLMLRSHKDGKHFDPRLVTLKFDLQGENGVYMPMVIDLQDGTLHWLDLYSKGQLEFNNVATSNKDIQRRCPELMAYFGSGVRPALFDLALLHAAARAESVYLRGPTLQKYARRPGEDSATFHQRILGGVADETPAALPSFGTAIGAALFRGDFAVPAGSTCYALFREQLTDVIAASELLSS